MTTSPCSPCKLDDRVYCRDSVSDTDAIVESDQSLLLMPGVPVTRSIVRIKQRKTTGLVTNFTEEYQHLIKGACIAFLQEIHKKSDVIAAADFQCEPEDASKPADSFDVNPALSQEKCNS